MGEDFNVKLTVRSGRILALVRERFGSQANMARAMGKTTTQVNAFVCLRASPIGRDGFTEAAQDFAGALGVDPHELWPEHMRDVVLKRSTAEVSLSHEQVAALVGGDASEAIGHKQVIKQISANLSPRERVAIEATMDGAAVDEIAELLGGVSRPRAWQIQQKAMRKMREKARCMGIRTLTDAI